MKEEINILVEESYDNIEFEEIAYSETEETEKNEEDVEIVEDIKKRKYLEESAGDWAVDGLDKTYADKEFDPDKAKALFYSFLDDSCEFDVNKQCEAVRYANYYAKCGNDEAKNFVVFVIQSRVGEASRIAMNSLNLFLRNYIRREVEKFYSRQPISDRERYERCQEAIQECFVYISKQIYGYDPTKGKITTYYCSKIINGIVSEFEAKRKGRGSKQTMKMDKEIVNAYKELVAAGYKEPSVRQLSLVTGKNVEAILNSKARVSAENSMTSFDSADPNNPTALRKSQSAYSQPDDYVLNKEYARELLDKMDFLPEMETEIFLKSNGLEIVGDMFIEVLPVEAYDLAKEYGLKVNEVKHIINSVTKKLKNKFGGEKTDKKDKLLSGRRMTFASDAEDLEACIVIDDIEDVI